MNYYRNDSDSELRFLAGLIIGGAVGALATVFLTPKTGEENRAELQKRINDAVKQIKQKGTSAYNKGREELENRMDKMKDKIDRSKYLKLVDQVIIDLQDDGQLNEDTMDDVKSKLTSDWQEFKKKLS